ncbi:hypothetical protein [Nocardioides nematodiphilus]|uniref:hypothetical protein n=1 Tax=Nocardioides nematodiphilus TaxID=2849669 RepID=UPI001CD9A2A3|nr:hypothetical protein [Nocardioides nematodiphilus]MCA1983473.1 hypothetical protein [Nocardioides nematodiphilus]
MNDELDNELNDDTRITPAAEPRLESPQSEAAAPEQALPYEEPQLTLPQPAAPRRGGTHPVNVGHLVMGLVFLAAVGVWALIQSDTVTGDDTRWLLPLPWVIGGSVGLVAAAISSVRRHGTGR